MCNPTAALAVTSIVSAGAKMASDAQAARYQSDEAEKDAKLLRAQGVEQERQLRQKAAREQAQRRVAVLKGGVTTEGSPTDMMLDAAREDDVAARWARFDRSEAAKAKQREAGYRRRQSVLDQLNNTNALGADLIRLKS